MVIMPIIQKFNKSHVTVMKGNEKNSCYINFLILTHFFWCQCVVMQEGQRTIAKCKFKL